jgi:hypothetical protein
MKFFIIRRKSHKEKSFALQLTKLSFGSFSIPSKKIERNFFLAKYTRDQKLFHLKSIKILIFSLTYRSFIAIIIFNNSLDASKICE